VFGDFKWFLTISQAVEFQATFQKAASSHGSPPMHTTTEWPEVCMTIDTALSMNVKNVDIHE